jgi:hypothetical protein
VKEKLKKECTIYRGSERYVNEKKKAVEEKEAEKLKKKGS